MPIIGDDPTPRDTTQAATQTTGKAAKKKATRPARFTTVTQAIRRLHGHLPAPAHDILETLMAMAGHEHGVRLAVFVERVRRNRDDALARLFPVTGGEEHRDLDIEHYVTSALAVLEAEGLVRMGTKREGVVVGYKDARKKQPVFEAQDVPFVFPLKLEEWVNPELFLAGCGIRLP